MEGSKARALMPIVPGTLVRTCLRAGQLMHQQNMLADYTRTGIYHAAITGNPADFAGKVRRVHTTSGGCACRACTARLPQAGKHRGCTMGLGTLGACQLGSASHGILNAGRDGRGGPARAIVLTAL